MPASFLTTLWGITSQLNACIALRTPVAFPSFVGIGRDSSARKPRRKHGPEVDVRFMFCFVWIDIARMRTPWVYVFHVMMRSFRPYCILLSITRLSPLFLVSPWACCLVKVQQICIELFIIVIIQKLNTPRLSSISDLLLCLYVQCTRFDCKWFKSGTVPLLSLLLQIYVRNSVTGCRYSVVYSTEISWLDYDDNYCFFGNTHHWIASTRLLPWEYTQAHQVVTVIHSNDTHCTWVYTRLHIFTLQPPCCAMLPSIINRISIHSPLYVRTH